MLDETILKVKNVSKLYSRDRKTTQQRLASTFWRALFLRPSAKIETLDAGEFWSLKDISFSLKRSEALGVIGLNGAGKTTLLRLLSRQLLPDEGEISMLGRTAAMIDLTAGFQMTASGKQNIFLRGAMLGRSREQILATYDEIVAFAELGDAIEASINTYSSGMMMRLAFSIMVAMKPDILFIDEVLAVGDFRFRQKCLGKIRQLREHSAFVLVSHSMGDIKLFCNRAIVLHEGHIAFEGKPDEAVIAYEEMKFPDVVNEEEKQQEILKPQYHNEEGIEGIEHFWCDADGNHIDKIRSGETLYYRVSFKLAHTPTNLIIGVPVWEEDGTYVTGFSTKRDGSGLPVEAGQQVCFTLKVPSLSLNPGDYVSNLSIHDGPEFIYRGQNNVLTVGANGNDSWGLVSIDHTWTGG